MWRHGERASQVDQYPIYEKDWIYGGGGLGELTAIGMGEMNELGWLIRKRYVTKLKFLTPKYASREVYPKNVRTCQNMIISRYILDQLISIVPLFRHNHFCTGCFHQACMMSKVGCQKID